jgi:hypothetical protein
MISADFGIYESDTLPDASTTISDWVGWRQDNGSRFEAKSI